MRGFLLKWFISGIALLVVLHTVSGVSINNWQTTVVASLILGLINAFIRPLILLLTLPFNILSLGILTLFINGAIFYLAAHIVKGFAVSDFQSAFWAALIFSIVSFFLNLLIVPDKN